MDGRIDISKPLYDQSTFIGRVRHFAFITDPRTVFSSDKQLDDAKQLIEQYRYFGSSAVSITANLDDRRSLTQHVHQTMTQKQLQGKEPKGTTIEQLIYAKKLYESSFHPDTGDKQNVFGRMSFQVPGGMLITGAMLQFYRTSTAVIFWQWVNQSFNALVNYTNRNAKSSISTTQLGTAYVSATASALIAALGSKKFLATKASPLLQRYVPFVAVAAANCVNIPLMRQGEILEGIALFDENGNNLTESRVAAVKGISQVVFSRIFMALPGMTILPIIFEKLEKQDWMKKIPKLHAPMQVTGAGLFAIKTSTLQMLEPEAYEKLLKNTSTVPERLYFNKGL